MTNYVRTFGQQIVSNVVKRALGGRGRGSNNSSDFNKLDRVGKSSTTGVGHGASAGVDSYQTLSFPLDVLSDPNMGNHGHYIQFFINEQNAAKIKFNEKSSAIQNSKTALKQFNMPYANKTIGAALREEYTKRIQNRDQNWNDFYSETGMASGAADYEKTFALDPKEPFKVKRAPTTRSSTCINMFMPAQVQTTYSANYTDTTIGAFSEDALQAFDQLMAGSFDDFGKTVAGASEPVKETIMQMMTTLVGTLGPLFGGLEEVRQMREGRIIADKMELAFKGVPKRNFSYTFKMMPRSEPEMEQVRSIVTAFKQNMLPETVAANSRRLVVPNTFHIQYMYVNDVNNYLHKIGECVLETMNVSYGGDRYKTFTAVPGEGAPPVETTLTLNFKEFHFLTRKDIKDGY
jgi:hypothetical protein